MYQNKFKGILLDLDNTIYAYDTVHRDAMEVVYQLLKERSINRQEAEFSFEQARSWVHAQLKGTAASHNRLLYFQKMCELLKIPVFLTAIELHNGYWNKFLTSLKLEIDARNFFHRKKYPICLVTDLTCHIQYQKCSALGIEKFIDAIVTSEEAGHEKPHPYPFLLALQKLQLKPEEVCMIGDDYQKDVLGAANLGIFTFWLNRNNSVIVNLPKQVKEIKSFYDLSALLN